MNIKARQDAILRSLRRNGRSTIKALALEVGALRKEGHVIHADVGRCGGLQSVQTNARLSVPEVFALLVSVAAMRAAGNLPFSDLADAGLAKIERALPTDKLKDLRRVLDRLPIGAGMCRLTMMSALCRVVHNGQTAVLGSCGMANSSLKTTHGLHRCEIHPFCLGRWCSSFAADDAIKTAVPSSLRQVLCAKSTAP